MKIRNLSINEAFLVVTNNADDQSAMEMEWRIRCLNKAGFLSEEVIKQLTEDIAKALIIRAGIE